MPIHSQNWEHLPSLHWPYDVDTVQRLVPRLTFNEPWPLHEATASGNLTAPEMIRTGSCSSPLPDSVHSAAGALPRRSTW